MDFSWIVVYMQFSHVTVSLRRLVILKEQQQHIFIKARFKVCYINQYLKKSYNQQKQFFFLLSMKVVSSLIVNSILTDQFLQTVPFTGVKKMSVFNGAGLKSEVVSFQGCVFPITANRNLHCLKQLKINFHCFKKLKNNFHC